MSWDCPRTGHVPGQGQDEDKRGQIYFGYHEKYLLNKKFKIKQFCKENKAGILIYDELKKKNIYGKVKATIKEKIGLKYKIRIEADYDDLNLNQNDKYIVEYNLLL